MITTQKFKGDDLELQMEASASPAFDLVGAALDDFLANGFNADPFLLMLFDEGRAPFSARVPRDSFVEFIKEALVRFPNTGTFETYLFILEKVFGEGSGVLFDVPAPGKLELLVNASSSIEYTFVAREFIDGHFVNSDLVTASGDTITFRGISGIDSEYKLSQLLAELIPAGIWPDVTLAFFSVYDAVAYEGGSFYNLVDNSGNQIIFFEGE